MCRGMPRGGLPDKAAHCPGTIRGARKATERDLLAQARLAVQIVALPLNHDARRHAPTSHPSFNGREIRAGSLLLIPSPQILPTVPQLTTLQTVARRPGTFSHERKAISPSAQQPRRHPCQPNPKQQDRVEPALHSPRFQGILPTSSITSTPPNSFYRTSDGSARREAGEILID
jgi:hypothetical protein